MINTIRYGAHHETEKDGKKQVVQIPPSVFLLQIGAMIQVTIAHPRSVQDELKEAGEEIPSVQINALIDTGASSSIITPKVAENLKLIHTGYQSVSSVQDEQKRPVYYGFMIFPWGAGKELPLISCPLKRFDCLIGRDILLHWHLNYNGPDGSIVICD